MKTNAGDQMLFNTGKDLLAIQADATTPTSQPNLITNSKGWVGFGHLMGTIVSQYDTKQPADPGVDK